MQTFGSEGFFFLCKGRLYLREVALRQQRGVFGRGRPCGRERGRDLGRQFG
jgi:hypothetical protein